MLVASCSSCLSATAEVTRAKPDSSLVDQLDDGGVEQPVHLIAEPGLHPPGAAVDPQSPHKVGERMIPDRSLPSRGSLHRFAALDGFGPIRRDVCL